MINGEGRIEVLSIYGERTGGVVDLVRRCVRLKVLKGESGHAFFPRIRPPVRNRVWLLEPRSTEYNVQ